MVTALKGILVEVDPSIKAVIVKINDQESGEYIIHELDDEHVLIHKDKLEKLKDHIQSKLREAMVIRNFDYLSNTDSE